MKRSSKDKVLPAVALRLKHLGEYLRVARKRRRMTMREVSERLNLGYQTVVRIEKGDPGVSIAAYMSVLWLFDLDRQLADAVHPDRDESGKALEYSRLPTRVGSKRTTMAPMETVPSGKRIGVAKGVFVVPDDIDTPKR